MGTAWLDACTPDAGAGPWRSPSGPPAPAAPCLPQLLAGALGLEQSRALPGRRAQPGLLLPSADRLLAASCRGQGGRERGQATEGPSGPQGPLRAWERSALAQRCRPGEGRREGAQKAHAALSQPLPNRGWCCATPARS